MIKFYPHYHVFDYISRKYIRIKDTLIYQIFNINDDGDDKKGEERQTKCRYPTNKQTKNYSTTELDIIHKQFITIKVFPSNNTTF